MKKILILVTIISSFSFAFKDDNNGFPNTNTEHTSGKTINSSNPLEQMFNKGESNNTQNNNKELDEHRNGLENVSNYDVWKSVNDFFEKVDSAFDQGFRAIDAAGTIASTGLAVAGSLPTVFGNGVPGASGAANTIQTMLQKFNQIRQRADALKEYKRQLERFKNLDPQKLKTLGSINSLLTDISSLINETTYLKSELKDFSKGYNANLKTSEGWDAVINDSKQISKLNKEINENVAGKNQQKTLQMIHKFKKEIDSMDSSTQLQSLQKLNANMSLLIALIEKQLQNDSLEATRAIAIEDKELQGQIAWQESRKKNMESLNESINSLKNKIDSNPLGTRFVGDVTGGK